MISKERKASFYSLSFVGTHVHKLKANESNSPLSTKIVSRAPDLLIEGLSKGVFYEAGKEKFVIVNYEIHAKYILILFNFTTDRYSDPTYYDEKSNKRNQITKLNSERMEFSCHVMIKRSLVNGESEMIVEKVSGFSKARLTNLINKAFRESKSKHPKDFEYNHPDGSKDTRGNPRKCKFKFTVRVDGVPSSQMKNDIENGKISGLELVSRKKFKKWDQHGHFIEKSTHVKLDFNAPSGTRMDNLKVFLGSIKKDKPDLDHAKLRFTPPGQTKGTESAEFDLSDSDPTNCEYYNKTASLNYSADNTSYTDIINDIKNSMKYHLRIT
ncbi:hypothetical protein QT231_02720 [Halomonas sp. SpR1]|uniref:hypothetical protein n=1 Tax=Halomonas sp. SpR1 TaxID=3050462 RepID=UPI0027E47269|nr:hypothetical protein [Halomonas sp. SpR1]MDQ7731594.1 hypothetical protein [Halomonas sp. SpR1]